MKAVISRTGDVESLELVSGHPLLAPVALDAGEAMEIPAVLAERKCRERGNAGHGELRADCTL